MHTIVTIILYVFVSFAFLSLAFLTNRNIKVCEERKRILKLISAMNTADIFNRHFNWEWRYEEFEKITYNEMMWKLWKPVNSFYKDHSCLKEIKEESYF